MHQSARHCGTTNPHDFISLGNEVRVTFASDATNVARGFSLMYSLASKSYFTNFNFICLFFLYFWSIFISISIKPVIEPMTLPTVGFSAPVGPLVHGLEPVAGLPSLPLPEQRSHFTSESLELRLGPTAVQGRWRWIGNNIVYTWKLVHFLNSSG